MNSSIPSADSTPPLSSPPGQPGGGDFFGKIFLGPHGLRAGWRLLIFAFIIVAIYLASAPFVVRLLRGLPSSGMPTPASIAAGEGYGLVLVLIAAAIMTLIEKRGFGDYGLPWRRAFQSRFWEGTAWGFVALSVLIGLLAAAGTLSLGGASLSASAELEQGFFWCLSFIAVGMFEEFAFRGYALATLTDGIGFWPAAVVLSLGFGALHLGNTGESYVGALSAAGIGFVFCLALRRTGTLWFPIGLHAAWDWGETYFYGVPDSGQVARGHLLSSSSHGSAWLSGGTVGPEGSVLVFIVIVALWVLISLRFRRVRFPKRPADAPAMELT